MEMSCNGKTSGVNRNFGKKSGNSATSDLCKEYKCCNNAKDCDSGTML